MALLEFYGKECPHCIAMMPLVERVEKDLKVEIRKLETWHNPENEEQRKRKDANGDCGGVPFFVNEETGKTLCGESSYEEILAWAKGE